METSIGKVGFLGETYQKIWCLTHIETLRYYYSSRVNDVPCLKLLVQARCSNFLVQLVTNTAHVVFGTWEVQEMKQISRMHDH